MDHLAISVCDQARSRVFYETYFGFGARPARLYQDGVMMLYDSRDFALALAPSAEPPAHAPFAHFGRRLSSPGAVRELRDRLAADGVPLVQESEEADYVSVKCRDPDGHVVEAFWEPAAAESHGERLSLRIDARRLLRSLNEADAEELHALVEANREHLIPWMPWAAAQTLQGTSAFVASSVRQAADRQGLQLAIVEDDGIVGVIGFHRVDWENRSTSIGYWIAESAQGRGTVTRAVRALVDHAFAAWELHRVEIRAGTGNLRSRAIPSRLGFREEGVLREAERVGERYIDHVLYAVLAREWDPPRV
jgi:ribosomal-protein-serine acetyltransferase